MLFTHHNLVAVTGVLLFSCTETNEPPFPGCSVWWGAEPLNLQYLSQRPFSVLVELGIDCW